jgi:hypothetical protein
MHLSSKWIEENRWPIPPIATTAIAITESNFTAGRENRDTSQQ